MESFKNQHCKPCEGGVAPLDAGRAKRYLDQLPGWALSGDGSYIVRKFTFDNFLHTISFINAMAWVAEQQGHHPDFSAGYKHCEVRYTTHAINGLSENDFICGARINELLES